jgi:hypothetical protein
MIEFGSRITPCIETQRPLPRPWSSIPNSEAVVSVCEVSWTRART